MYEYVGYDYSLQIKGSHIKFCCESLIEKTKKRPVLAKKGKRKATNFPTEYISTAIESLQAQTPGM